jgi:hypothetical protein
LLSKPSKRDDDDEDIKPAKKQYTGAQKMQYGVFRKAKIVEEDEEQVKSKNHDLSEEERPQ